MISLKKIMQAANRSLTESQYKCSQRYEGKAQHKSGRGLTLAGGDHTYESDID
jgi:hypothetical protein